MIPKFRVFIKIKNAINPVQPIGAINFEGETITIEQGLTFPFDKAILMQYTGHVDRHGTEIYEDDLVADEYNRIYRVVFKGDCWRCEPVKGGSKNRWISTDLEVVGNAHEDSELIE